MEIPPLNTARLQQLLVELLSIPTAPFHEHAIARYIIDRVKGMGLSIQADWYGNLYVRRPSTGRTRDRLAFMAHMDHPGFEAVEVNEDIVSADFLGGVHPSYFMESRVRFYHEGDEFPGEVVEVTADEEGNRARFAKVHCPSPPPVGALGMWDLPRPELGNGKIRATALDDVAGCALLLGMLETLGDEPLDTEVYALFTRAEEAGFIGALGMARIGTLPRSLPVISVEMSKAMGSIGHGLGPVIRLGDSATVFDNALTMMMKKQAAELKDRNDGFLYQTALMTGGSCEATVMNAYGFPSAGLAIPLGNYHNQTPSNPNGGGGVIDSEEINFSDLKNGIEFAADLCIHFKPFDAVEDELLQRLLTRGEKGLKRLELDQKKRTR